MVHLHESSDLQSLRQNWSEKRLLQVIAYVITCTTFNRNIAPGESGKDVDEERETCVHHEL
jgi:hypothetical protein